MLSQVSGHPVIEGRDELLRDPPHEPQAFLRRHSSTGEIVRRRRQHLKPGPLEQCLGTCHVLRVSHEQDSPHAQGTEERSDAGRLLPCRPRPGLCRDHLRRESKLAGELSTNASLRRPLTACLAEQYKEWRQLLSVKDDPLEGATQGEIAQQPVWLEAAPEHHDCMRRLEARRNATHLGQEIWQWGEGRSKKKQDAGEPQSRRLSAHRMRIFLVAIFDAGANPGCGDPRGLLRVPVG